MSSEACYLFRLAGPDQKEGQPVGACPSDLSWDELLRLADEEKAIPALFERHKRTGMAGLTPAQSRRLQQYTFGWTARMAYLEQRLERLLALYDDAGVPVLLLKGAALATTVYGSFARRPMADLDLLVDSGRAQEAWDLARGAGWSCLFEAQSREVYRKHQHLAPLDDAHGTGLGLELHTELFPADGPFAFGADALWQHSVEVQVAGRRAWVPSDLHMVLHLCTHFAWSHGLADAAWRTFRDLQTLIDAGRVDWTDVVRHSRETRSLTCVYWTFRLGRQLAGITVPDDVLAELAPPAGERWLRPLERYYRTVLCRPGDWQDPTTVIAKTLWQLGIRPGWSGHGAARPWRQNQAFDNMGPAARARNAASHGAPSERTPRRWRQLFKELRALAP